MLPSVWKLADVTTLPKKKLVRDLKNDLRPISLTSCISKIAEDFVVCDYVKPAVLQALDNNQFGAVPRSFTTLALLEVLILGLRSLTEMGPPSEPFVLTIVRLST